MSVYDENVLDTHIFYNNSDEDTVRTFSRDGSNFPKLQTGEMLITSHLSQKYEGSSRLSCRKHIPSVHEDLFQERIVIPRKTSVKVALNMHFLRNECMLHGIKLIFPKKANIKCEVVDPHTRNKRVQKCKFVEIFIKDVLKDCIDVLEESRLTSKICGTYIWFERKLHLVKEVPKALLKSGKYVLLAATI